MVPSVGSRGQEGTQILGGGVLVPSSEFEKVAEGEKTALFQPAVRVLRLIVWRRGRVRWNRLKKRRVMALGKSSESFAQRRWSAESSSLTSFLFQVRFAASPGELSSVVPGAKVPNRFGRPRRSRFPLA